MVGTHLRGIMATIYGRKHTIRRGYLLVPQEMTGPSGKIYTVDLEYQVFDSETGAPISDTGTVEGEQHGNRLIVGDPHRDTRLFEYTIAAQPTAESRDYWRGYQAALGDRQWHREGSGKKYYAQTQSWWDGYNQGHRDKRDPSASEIVEGFRPNEGSNMVVLTEEDYEALSPAQQKAWPGYTYGMTYETWDEEALEAGDTDDKGWLTEETDVEPLPSLEELLRSSDIQYKSWLEWSSSPPDGRSWIVGDEEEDMRTGDRTLHELFIRRVDKRPLSDEEIRYITEQLGLYGYRRNTQRSNAADHYVWVLGRSGEPLSTEGPYGPYALSRAETFARIAATKGAHDRAVSRGLDPLASTFTIVRRYRAGTGERTL